MLMPKEIEEYRLTTEDNPYSPFTEFSEWYAFDVQKGYYTCDYLDRITNTSNGISDENNLLEIEDAIDEAIRINLTGNYKKVKRSDYAKQ